jgi:hypothetical protein
VTKQLQVDKQACAADRFGAVEVMTRCGQAAFRSSLAAALPWVGRRARHPAGAPARWSELGVADRYTDGVSVCSIHT